MASRLYADTKLKEDRSWVQPLRPLAEHLENATRFTTVLIGINQTKFAERFKSGGYWSTLQQVKPMWNVFCKTTFIDVTFIVKCEFHDSWNFYRIQILYTTTIIWM